MCDFEPLISRYLDGEGSRTERRRAEEHLLGCDVCAQAKRRRLELSALLRSAEELKAPADLADLVMARIANDHRALGALDHWLERRNRTELASLAAALSALFAVGAPALRALSTQPAVVRFIWALEMWSGQALKAVAAPFGTALGL